MVSEHKIRQQLYHHLNPRTSDSNVDIPYTPMINRDLAFCIIDYFFNPAPNISYPAKSYAVALIYAHQLEKHFLIPYDQSLRDPELLFNNDPHYVPYQENQEVYDMVLTYLNNNQYNLPYYLPQVSATVDYFDQEFFINPNPYFDNANLHK